jgi:hypothetical protein
MTDRDDLRRALEEAKTAFVSAMEESQPDSTTRDEKRALFHLAAGLRCMTLAVEGLSAQVERLQRAEAPVGIHF